MKKPSKNISPKGDKEKFPLWGVGGFQMAATVLAGYLLGAWLDEKYAMEKNYWTMGLSLFAVLVSLYQMIRQAMGN